jgi:hypothetical protein
MVIPDANMLWDGIAIVKTVIIKIVSKEKTTNE